MIEPVEMRSERKQVWSASRFLSEVRRFGSPEQAEAMARLIAWSEAHPALVRDDNPREQASFGYRMALLNSDARFWMAYARPGSGLRLELQFRVDVRIRAAEWLAELGERLAGIPGLHWSPAELAAQPSLPGAFLACAGAPEQFMDVLDWAAEEVLRT